MAGITPQQWNEDRERRERVEQEAINTEARDRERASGKREQFYGSTVPGSPLSHFKRAEVRWLQKPYFPRDALSLLVGEPGVGKSSLIAWLISQAKSAILFPGFEESFTVQTLPRLQMYPLRDDQVRVITEREWSFPDSRTKLIRTIASLQADLVILDPISSYLSCAEKENDGPMVRTSLESLAMVAADTGCCIVGVRHPGKDSRNVMVGSREWRAVPRSVVQLMIDPGPPMRRVIRLNKDMLGQGHSARTYILPQEQGQPPVWKFGDSLSVSESTLLDHYSDDVDRARFDHAQNLLIAALADGEQPSKALYSLAEAERISERTLFRAAQSLGIQMERKGNGLTHQSIWSIPPQEAPHPHSRQVGETPPLRTSTEGECQSVGGSGALEQFRQTGRYDDEPQAPKEGTDLPSNPPPQPAAPKAKTKRGRPKKGGAAC